MRVSITATMWDAKNELSSIRSVSIALEMDSNLPFPISRNNCKRSLKSLASWASMKTASSLSPFTLPHFSKLMTTTLKLRGEQKSEEHRRGSSCDQLTSFGSEILFAVLLDKLTLFFHRQIHICHRSSNLPMSKVVLGEQQWKPNSCSSSPYVEERYISSGVVWHRKSKVGWEARPLLVCKWIDRTTKQIQSIRIEKKRGGSPQYLNPNELIWAIGSTCQGRGLAFHDICEVPLVRKHFGLIDDFQLHGVQLFDNDFSFGEETQNLGRFIELPISDNRCCQLVSRF